MGTEKMLESETNDAFKPIGPLDEPAGDWFVNRKEELDLFWKWGTDVPPVWRNSYALIGPRRMGKTAILHKVFNRLFHEQKEVMPVYISFARYLHRAKPINAYEFAEEFVGSYVASYLAFHHGLSHLFKFPVEFDELELIASKYPDEIPPEVFRRYKGVRYGELSSVYQLVHWAISVPKGFASLHEMPTVLMIDEFQVLTNVYNPESGMYNDVTNGFQHASESRWAPMLVSGSSVSMMSDEAIAGMLSGRFKPWYLYPLEKDHAIEMASRLGQALNLNVTGEVAEAIWKLTQGYPYPIECILTSASPDVQRLPDLDALDRIVLFEQTNRRGILREHYENEYGKYVRQLNGTGITRKILYWITNHPEEKIIRPHTVASELNIDIVAVQESLEKLCKIDVIERATIASFSGPKDPLLREFLRYEHYVDVQNLPPEDAAADMQKRIHRTTGELNRRTGHYTEIIVGSVLNNFDDREVDGSTYFGISTAVKLPRMQNIIRREGVLKAGIPKEIDVIGEYNLHNDGAGNKGLGAWMVSVRYRKRKMNDVEVRKFIDQVQVVQTEKEYGEVIPWYFSKSGFTKKGIVLLQAEGIYHSDLQQFNQLSDFFGLLPLKM